MDPDWEKKEWRKRKGKEKEKEKTMDHHFAQLAGAVELFGTDRVMIFMQARQGINRPLQMSSG